MLQAAARAHLEIVVQAGKLVEPGAHLAYPSHVRFEQLGQRGALRVTSQGSIRPQCTTQAPALHRKHDQQNDEHRTDGGHDEGQVVGQDAIQLGQRRAPSGGGIRRRPGRLVSYRPKTRDPWLDEEARRPGPAPQRPLQGVVSEAIEAAAETRAVAAQERAERPTPPRAAPRRSGRADPRFTISGPSRLSAGAAAEYHYVLRDVRNIGVLVAVMAVLLIAAVLLFHALGLGTG